MMVIKHPCKICRKPVAKNHKAINCDNCNIWVHIKCNHNNKTTYEHLQKDQTFWYCMECTKEIFPFSNLGNEAFIQTQEGKNNTLSEYNFFDNQNNIDNLFQQINHFEEENNDKLTSKYYDVNNLNNLNINNKTNSAYFHINISSLPYHFDELLNLLASCKLKFKVIGISESRITSTHQPLTPILLPGYAIEQTTTESTKGGTLLYISNDTNYKSRKDLQIYKSKLLESTFIEIINSKQKNLIK